MILIGAHCNFTSPDYFLGAVKEAISYDATALMVYTGAPQNFNRAPLEKLKIKEGLELIKNSNIKEIIVHAPYILNLANQDQEKQNFAIEVLTAELIRASHLNAKCIVLHPGNFLTDTPEIAIDRIIKNIKIVLKNTPDIKTTIALETMAGKGTEVGITFKQIKAILDGINEPKRMSVCLDTCHIFDGGYDLKNNYEEVIAEFDQIVGLNNLSVIHLNDSKFGLSSHKDRHANIGDGLIGFETLLKVAYDERFAHVAKILETPYINNKAPYKEEIAMLNKKTYQKIEG